ncbi:exported hypothetical protein [Gammaproteobacteria bacterium]
MKRFLSSFFILVAASTALLAQPLADSGVDLPVASRLRVVVKPAEPFSFEKNGQITGYSVDLWKRVALEAGFNFDMKMVKAALEALEADVGVGAISITQEREKVLDFSHPFFESGLQILAPSQRSGSAFAAFRSLFSGDVLKVISVFLLAVFAVSTLLWLVERKNNGARQGCRVTPPI